jgi:hypothetical protein
VLHIRPWEWDRLTEQEGMWLMDYLDRRFPSRDDAGDEFD